MHDIILLIGILLRGINMKEEKNVKTIQSVNRAFDILEYLVSVGDGKKLTDIADHFGLNKTTTFHLLKTLEARGYVEQNTDAHQYSYGGKMFELGLQAYRNVNLNIYSQPYLNKLINMYDETAALFHYLKRNGNVQSICTSLNESTQSVKVSLSLGEWYPLSCTASGLMYLSCLNDESLNSAIEHDSFPEKIPDKTTLTNLLTEARTKSHIIERELYQSGVVSIAAPIYKYTGRVIASLCVMLPIQRAEEDYINEIAVTLTDMTKELSELPL